MKERNGMSRLQHKSMRKKNRWTRIHGSRGKEVLTETDA